MKGKDMQKQVLEEILQIMSISDTKVHTNDKLLKQMSMLVVDQEKVRLDFMIAVAENINLN